MQIGTFWTTGIIPGSNPAMNPLLGENSPAPAASDSEIVDELLLSDEAEQSRELPRVSDLHANNSTRAAPGQFALEIEELNFDHKTLLADFQTQLSNRLQQRGVDRDSEIQLTVASDGRVIVTNDHSHRDEIESIFRDEPRLRNQFAQISGQASFLKAAQEAIAFQETYREDPIQAVNDFHYLFERKNAPNYSMLIAGETFTSALD